MSRPRQCCAPARQLFDTSCVTCHGVNLQGVADRGPSLIGVGEAAVYFQVSTGRMPAMRGEAQAPQKPPQFDEAQIDALGAYVQANGGGPEVPRDENGQIAQESLIGDDVARGGDLFRLNCASCHNFTGKGGALSSGKYAPDLSDAEPAQIYTAMLTGPQNMPKFSDRQLSPDEKRDIVAYVRMAAEAPDPGGYGLGGSRTHHGRHGHLDHRDCGHRRGGPVDRSTVVTDAENTPKGTDAPGQPAFRGSPATPNWRRCRARNCSSSAANSTASRSCTRKTRWPVQGTKAEKRAERSVANWLLLGGFSGLALLLVFLFWPWEYKGRTTPGHWWYDLATPLYGLTFGLSILAIGIGAVLFQKKFIPEEISIQDRHDGSSPEIQRKTVAANLTRCAGGLNDQAAQADRAVARHRSRRIRRRHTGRIHRRPDQEPVETGGPDRRRQEGRVVDVGMDPDSSRARPSSWPAPPETPATEHRSSRCAPRTSTRAAWKPCSRGGSPTATAPQSNHTTGSTRSRWVCATP